MTDDLEGILQMFRAGPTPEEKQAARQHAMLRAGFGILSANQPSQFPKSALGILGTGGLAGLEGYNNELRNQMAERRTAGLTAVQAMGLKRQLDMEAARKSLFAGTETPMAPVQVALAQGAQAGDVGPTLGNVARLDAAQAPNAAPQYPQIPMDRIRQAMAAGVPIGEALKYNEALEPKTRVENLGNEQVIRDLRTNQIIQRMPMGAAPASRPYEAQDIPPSEYRDFLTGKAKAGATTVPITVSTGKKYGETFATKIAEADRDMRDTAMKAPELATRANRVLETLASGKVITGAGADYRLALGKALGLAGLSDKETLANTESLVSDLAGSTLDAIQGSGLGSGQGFTDKDRQFLQDAKAGRVTMEAETIRRLATLSHKAAVSSADKWGTRVNQIPSEALEGTGVSRDRIRVPPIFAPRGASGPQINPETQRLLDRYAPQ
jgi:hypothetical protein